MLLGIDLNPSPQPVPEPRYWSAVTDPLTLFLELARPRAAGVCEGRSDTFDARRRITLEFGAISRTARRNMICSTTLAHRAGPDWSDPVVQSHEFKMLYMVGDEMAQLAALAASTRYGTLRARRR